MSRRLANRPRFHHQRISPRPLHLAHKEYLRQRWTYRQPHVSYTKHPLGHGVSLLPIGWQFVRDVLKRGA